MLYPKNAYAVITKLDGESGSYDVIGSGFLVGSCLLLTAHHVFKKFDEYTRIKFLVEIGSGNALSFDWEPVFLEELWLECEDQDWAILRIADPQVPLTPMTLSPANVNSMVAVGQDLQWGSYAFSSKRRFGGPITGKVKGLQVMPRKVQTDETMTVLALYSDEAASGRHIRGHSGMPVLLGQHVVGMFIGHDEDEPGALRAIRIETIVAATTNRNPSLRLWKDRVQLTGGTYLPDGFDGNLESRLEPMTTRKPLARDTADAITSRPGTLVSVCGVPGWGKTLFIEAVASSLEPRPLLKLDLSHGPQLRSWLPAMIGQIADVEHRRRLTGAAVSRGDADATTRLTQSYYQYFDEVEQSPWEAWARKLDGLLGKPSLIVIEGLNPHALDEANLTEVLGQLRMCGHTIVIEAWPMPPWVTRLKGANLSHENLPKLDSGEVQEWGASVLGRQLSEEEAALLELYDGHPGHTQHGLKILKRLCESGQFARIEDSMLGHAQACEGLRDYGQPTPYDPRPLPAELSGLPVTFWVCGAILPFRPIPVELVPELSSHEERLEALRLVRRDSRTGDLYIAREALGISFDILRSAREDTLAEARRFVECLRATVPSLESHECERVASLCAHLPEELRTCIKPILSVSMSRIDDAGAEDMFDVSSHESSLVVGVDAIESVDGGVQKLRILFAAIETSDRQRIWSVFRAILSDYEGELLDAMSHQWQVLRLMHGILVRLKSGGEVDWQAMSLLPSFSKVSDQSGAHSLWVTRLMILSAEIHFIHRRDGPGWRLMETARSVFATCVVLTSGHLRELRRDTLYRLEATPLVRRAPLSEEIAIHEASLRAIPAIPERDHRWFQQWALRSLRHRIPLLRSQPGAESWGELLTEFNGAVPDLTWFRLWRRTRDSLPHEMATNRRDLELSLRRATSRLPGHRKGSPLSVLTRIESHSVKAGFVLEQFRTFARSSQETLLGDEEREVLIACLSALEGRLEDVVDQWKTLHSCCEATIKALDAAAESRRRRSSASRSLRRQCLRIMARLDISRHLGLPSRDLYTTYRGARRKVLDLYSRFATGSCPWTSRDMTEIQLELQRRALSKLRKRELCDRFSDETKSDLVNFLGNHGTGAGAYVSLALVRREHWELAEALDAITEVDLRSIEIEERGRVEEKLIEIVSPSFLYPRCIRYYEPMEGKREELRAFLRTLLRNRGERDGRLLGKEIAAGEAQVVQSRGVQPATWADILALARKWLGEPEGYWSKLQNIAAAAQGVADSTPEHAPETLELLTDARLLDRLSWLLATGLGEETLPVDQRVALGEMAVMATFYERAWLLGTTGSIRKGIRWRTGVTVALLLGLRENREILGTTDVSEQGDKAPRPWRLVATQEVNAAKGGFGRFGAHAYSKGSELLAAISD